ncbi:hypothetical protein K1719_016431 [Acacia pycnantha]|nr:hypothetical protein K1719_016431 [Acacia pycnantha]
MLVAWMLQATEGNEERKVIMTKPLSLEADEEEDEAHDNGGRYSAPNLLQRILTIFSHLPATFNLPKSQLQGYGESIYGTKVDLIRRCNKGESPLERFINVLAWTISTIRPCVFGVAPYNPILGETHHVSHSSLNVLLEQVSHHPPVSALHATDEKENVEIIRCLRPLPKFHGIHLLSLLNI